jgi:hypothetical protein
MGAAQLLESLRTTPGFCAVVAECPFASFREASYDRLAERLDAGAWLGRTLLRPAVDTGFLYTRWKYGVDWDQASPSNAVAASSVPVLLVHGKKDTNLPPRHSEMILEHSSSRAPSVVLWEPEDAGHTGAAGGRRRRQVVINGEAMRLRGQSASSLRPIARIAIYLRAESGSRRCFQFPRCTSTQLPNQT